MNPETGHQTIAGEYPTKGNETFTTPQGSEDAVLLLDAVKSK